MISEAVQAQERPSFPLSSSVQSAVGGFGPGDEVGSWALVQGMLRLHPEYGRGLAKKLAMDPGPQGGERRTPSDWLEGVMDLLDRRKVPELHGRVLILGLARLDEQLQAYLSSAGFLDALQEELRERFEDLLVVAPTERLSDPTILHDDSPPAQDQLGRRGFAEALALWLTRFWQEARGSQGRSFVLHIHGPWGSGKTTLLRLLEEALHSPQHKAPPAKAPEWIVVWFNAWRHQHLNPPWWPLVDTIYREAVRQTRRYGDRAGAWAIQWRELVWRLRSGHMWHLIMFGVTLCLFLGLAGTLAPPQKGDWGAWLQDLGNQAKALAAVLALLGACWAGVQAVNQSLLAGSAESAKNFVGAAQDPMQRLRDHFPRLVGAIGRPVIVYVDDLDRCRPEYAVQLLEGIQTLFSDSRVFYAVAADRRWLYVCFEAVYRQFTDVVKEPGRQMGYLFLEKAFQLSVSVPRLSPDLQQSYLQYLVTGKQSDLSRALEEHRAAAAHEFEHLTTQEAILAQLARGTGNPLRDQLRREAAVRQSATEAVEAQTKHFLMPFAPLLEPNPRAMKRLVTAYGIHRALAMLGDADLVGSPAQRKQLALWTIISLRWPSLEEYLEEHPGKAASFREGTPDPDIPDHIRPLVKNQNVMDVFGGKGVGAPLDEDTIEALLGLKGSPGSAAVMA